MRIYEKDEQIEKCEEINFDECSRIFFDEAPYEKYRKTEKCENRF